MKRDSVRISANRCPFFLGGPFIGFLLCIALSITLSVAGCKTTGNDNFGQKFSRLRQSPQYQKIDDGGWVSIFLNVTQPRGPEISFEISSIEVPGEGQKHSFLSDPLGISSRNIGNGQLFVARNSLPAGTYSSLKLVLRNVVVSGQKQTISDTSKEIIVDLSFPSMLNIRKGESHSIFVTWDVFSSLNGKGEFTPEMIVSLQAIPFLSDLLFVACPEIDTIYAIRTDKNWVISSLGVEGGPTYMAVAEDSDRLYVLTPRKFSIQVIDLVTNKIVDAIYMPLDYEPSYMTVSPDNSFAYVLDEKGKNLIKVDLGSGSIVNRTVLSFQPRYAIFLEWQRRLAVSAFDTDAVYLIEPDSLENTGMLPVSSSPEGLLYHNNLLLVAESGTNTVTAYDLNTKQQKERVNVGFSPRRLLLRNNQIYVSIFGSSSIALMIPGQLNISREIFLKGNPLEMVSNESRLWIYAGDADRGGLNVIDSTSNTISGFVDLQALPSGIAVID